MPNIRESGLPVLYGPYIVDHTDIPHSGDSKTLWTPRVGDVLLHLFADWRTCVDWDHGYLLIGQNPSGTWESPVNTLANTYGGNYDASGFITLDPLDTGAAVQQFDSAGQRHSVTVTVFDSAVAVSVLLVETGGTDPTQGHVALYALIARAIAP